MRRRCAPPQDGRGTPTSRREHGTPSPPRRDARCPPERRGSAGFPLGSRRRVMYLAGLLLLVLCGRPDEAAAGSGAAGTPSEVAKTSTSRPSAPTKTGAMATRSCCWKRACACTAAPMPGCCWDTATAIRAVGVAYQTYHAAEREAAERPARASVSTKRRAATPSKTSPS